MRIVISGASGLIGRSLTADLEAAGFDLLRLTRSAEAVDGGGVARWQPDRGELDESLIAGADAVINLNGRNVGDGRWTEKVKQELRSSRIDSTRTLVGAIARCEAPPPMLINASAVGYYGDRGDEVLDESSPPGDDFLARLSTEWERAASAARSEHTRVVVVRLGMVVGRGGALERMLLPFKLGAGGPIGSGSQFWPWVAMDDVVGVIRFLLEHPEVEGPVNVVSPEESRCREFVRSLGRVLRRPAVLPLPAFAARLAMGEMADALLLASTRARPAALERLGYTFRVPSLEDAIRRAIA